jgi:hypothetical protein|tara:strand:- start:711 stop:908 length:198 start_codon:yes stop_codon:yes gene_type:complete
MKLDILLHQDHLPYLVVLSQMLKLLLLLAVVVVDLVEAAAEVLSMHLMSPYHQQVVQEVMVFIRL